jgi:hypothetical protein
MIISHSLRSYSIWDLSRLGARWIGRVLTNNFRCLPDYIILGTQRGGTTSLYNYLAGHPKILPGFLKETHFFDRYYKWGLGWYRANFPFRQVTKTSNSGLTHTYLTGEGTPYYLFHPHIPNRVKQAVPNARLIVLLRNPIDRAYSHYHHMVKNGLESLTFEKAIERELEIMPGEALKVLDNENYLSFAYQNYSYLSRGIYIHQLINWHKLFNREQILVLKSETLFDDPPSILGRTLDFLQLPRWEPSGFEKYNLAHYEPMNDLTQRMLAKYFLPYNLQLYEYLGEDFGW